MITYFIQSISILTLFFIAYQLVFKRFTLFHYNRFFLLLGIFVSLIFPFLPLNFSETKTEYVYLNQAELETISLTNFTTENASQFWESWTLSQVALGIYLAGVLVFTILFLVQIFQLSRIFHQGEIIQKDGIKLILTQKEISPFSFFNTIVINPNTYTNEQLNHIITHEKIHINHGHQIDVLIAEFMKITLWFYPISWLYSKAIRSNLEFIADHDSLKNGLDKKAYQLNLVTISQQSSGSSLVNNFSKKLIKHRIKMLNKMKTKNQITIVYIFLLPLFLGVSLGLSAQVQSQNKKVQQVVVLSSEKLNADEVQVQIKNENGEFETLDSTDITIIPTQSNSLSVITSQERTESSLNKIQDLENSTIRVKRSSENPITIIFQNENKNDTIFLQNLEFGVPEFDFNKLNIISQEKLKELIEKGTIDLNKKENQWITKSYINIDSLFKSQDSLVLKNAKIIQNIQKPDIIQIKNNNDKNKVTHWKKDEKGKSHYIIPPNSLQDGKKPLVIIDGEISTLKKLQKLVGSENLVIEYIESDELIKKYGQKAKDGVLNAKHK